MAKSGKDSKGVSGNNSSGSSSKGSKKKASTENGERKKSKVLLYAIRCNHESIVSVPSEHGWVPRRFKWEKSRAQ